MGRRIECGETHVYLLEQRFAFIGNLASEALTPLLEAALLTPDTVLCASGDDGSICGTVRTVQDVVDVVHGLLPDQAAA